MLGRDAVVFNRHERAPDFGEPIGGYHLANGPSHQSTMSTFCQSPEETVREESIWVVLRRVRVDERAAGHWARARERRQDVIEQAVEARAAKAKHQNGWLIHKTYTRGDTVVNDRKSTRRYTRH